MIYGRIHGTAACMAHYYDQHSTQMLSSIFDAPQLMAVDHVSGYTDHEEVSNACIENDFRNYPGVGAADNDGIGFLPV